MEQKDFILDDKSVVMEVDKKDSGNFALKITAFTLFNRSNLVKNLITSQRIHIVTENRFIESTESHLRILVYFYFFPDQGKTIGQTYNGSNETNKPTGQTASSSEDYISIIIGALAALIVILIIIVIFVIIRHKRRQSLNRQSLKPVSDTVLNNFQNMNGKVSNGNVYNGVATEEEDHGKSMNGKGMLTLIIQLHVY